MHETVSDTFRRIVEVRMLLFVFFVWSYCFAIGFLGRFRVTLYLATLLVPIILASYTQFEALRFGPLGLINPVTFGTERHEFPVNFEVQTLVMGLALVLGALGLALWREGSLAEVLSRPMSQQEKAVIAILFVGTLTASSILDRKRTKAPYEFIDQAVLASTRAPLQISYGDDRADAVVLLKQVEGDLVDLQQALGWRSLPAVRISYTPSFDGHTWETATLEKNDGVLVRVNFHPAADWDVRGFRAYLVADVLDQATHGRAAFDPQRWFEDGVARWWVERDGAGDVPMLRALWATRHGCPPDVTGWAKYREQMGTPIAEGVAFSMVKTLEARRGQPAVLALARSLYGRSIPVDFREFFYELRHPMPAVFESSTGMPWTEFLTAWPAWLTEQRTRFSAVLEKLPEGTGEVHVTRDIAYRFAFTRPPAPGTSCSLVHASLLPYDVELKPSDLQREEHPWAGQGDFVLPGRYSSGERVFVALEVDSPELACPMRLMAQREDVP